VSTEHRAEAAIRHSFVREAAMADMLLATRGYGAPEIRVAGPRSVVAACHKVVDGRLVRAEALGLDDLDAIRKLVKMVMRP